MTDAPGSAIAKGGSTDDGVGNCDPVKGKSKLEFKAVQCHEYREGLQNDFGVTSSRRARIGVETPMTEAELTTLLSDGGEAFS
jgi:hypothetical protein